MAVQAIPRVAVESSNIASIGYSAERKVLAVEFATGHVYHYTEVPPETHAGLLQANSKGRYFGAEIRGKFQADRQTGTCTACGDVGPLDETCTDCGAGAYAYAAGKA